MSIPKAPVLLIALVLGPGLCAAKDIAVDAALQELVIGVRSTETALPVYQNAFQWQVIHRGEGTSALARFWELPETAGISETLVGLPELKRRFVRLVEFRNVSQVRARPSPRYWDTGGISVPNAWVRDLDATFHTLLAHGWHGLNEPLRSTFGNISTVKEVIALGHDDLTMALVQRVEPPLPNKWGNFSGVSGISSMYFTVQDYERHLEFFGRCFGWPIVRQGETRPAEAKNNLFGVPANLLPTLQRRSAAFQPHPKQPASVVVNHFFDTLGRDLSANGRPPNVGPIIVRFQITDMGNLGSRLAECGTPFVGPVRLRLAPYGVVQLLALDTPEGARLEFFMRSL